MIKGSVQYAWAWLNSVEIPPGEYALVMRKKNLEGALRIKKIRRGAILYRVSGGSWAFRLVASMRGEQWEEKDNKPCM